MWTQVEPLADEPAQRAYWQEFKVGDRVRVRLSGECQLPRLLAKPGQLSFKQSGVGHEDAEHGLVGTIRGCPTQAAFSKCDVCSAQGHPHVVFYDSLLLTPKARLHGAHYAACELEPLEPAES